MGRDYELYAIDLEQELANLRLQLSAQAEAIQVLAANLKVQRMFRRPPADRTNGRIVPYGPADTLQTVEQNVEDNVIASLALKNINIVNIMRSKYERPIR
jgi:hypothetical protein